MKSQPFTLQELETMPLEALTDLWDKGLLSDATKDYLVKKVPFLNIIRQQEIEKENFNSSEE